MTHWGSALAGAVALAAAATPALADIAPRTVEVVMTATVRDASGTGLVVCGGREGREKAA
ncbi:MAG: hypothetical protein ACK40H_06135 [Sphingomonadaceae bacterium]